MSRLKNRVRNLETRTGADLPFPDPKEMDDLTLAKIGTGARYRRGDGETEDAFVERMAIAMERHFSTGTWPEEPPLCLRTLTSDKVIALRGRTFFGSALQEVPPMKKRAM